MPYDSENDIVESHASHAGLSNLEECPLNGDNDLIVRKQLRNLKLQWPGNQSFFWKFWSVAMTASSIILFATIIHDGNSQAKLRPYPGPTSVLRNYPHPIETWKKENLIKTKFYRDLRYMTLDHDADYLWQEHALMSTGNIRLPAEDGSDNSTLMSISM